MLKFYKKMINEKHNGMLKLPFVGLFYYTKTPMLILSPIPLNAIDFISSNKKINFKLKTQEEIQKLMDEYETHKLRMKNLLDIKMLMLTQQKL